MTLSINCLNRWGLFVAVAAGFLVLTACAGIRNTELINSPEKQHLHVAVFPVDNPSSAHVPLEEIRQSLIQRLKMQGADVLDDAVLEQFMAKHRVRYVAGLDTVTSESLSNEVGVNAVLIISVEAYSETSPPRIALFSRLVSTGSRPSVLWADSVGMAGNDHPGLLGLGLIEDPKVLQHKAVGKLGDLLTGYLAGEKAPTRGGRKSFGPKESFRSPVVGTDLRENTVGFVDSSSSGDEGKGPARLDVALTEVSGAPVTVVYAVTGGTAAEGKNYVVKGNTLTFAPGETLKSIEIDIRHDGLNTGDRTVMVSLKNPTGAVLGSSAVHTYTIIDRYPEPAVTFVVPSQQVKKNAGTATIGMELSAVSGRDVIVPFMVGGTAKTPGNYTMPPGPIVIKAGQRSAAITVTIADNGVNEDDKTVVVSMGVPTHASQGKTTTSTMTIIDSDPVPAVSFTTASQQVKENAGTATIGVELSAVSGRDVTIPFMVGGTAKTPGNYTMTPGPIVIKAGERSAAITVNVVDNGVNEDDKTVVVSMGVPTHAVQGKTTTTSTVTIIDTDPAPTVSFASASSRGSEKKSPVGFEVALSAPSGKLVTVEYGVKGGTAIPGKDYALPGGFLTFEPGETNKTLVVDIKNHGIYSDDKTFEVVLKNPKNAALGSTAVHTHTIMISGAREHGRRNERAVIKNAAMPLMMLAMANTPGNPTIMPGLIAAKTAETEEQSDEVPLPTVEFLYASSRGDEKVSSVLIPVGLGAPSGKPVTVEYGVTGGTAEAGKQYEVKGTSLNFAPGETVKDIEITVKDDGVNRDDTTIEVSLKNPTGAVLGGTAVHTYTIIDSSPEPAVTFTVASRQVEENAGKATVGVELSAVSGRDVTVPLMVGGTAKTPGNYTIAQNPVVIKAGQRSAAITVNVVDNGVNEDDKTVVVSMGVPTNAVQGKMTTSTMTIIDTDHAPAVSFASASSSGEEQSGASASSSGEEQSGAARLEVVLSAPSGKPVTVEYGVKGGTAILGKDYALPGGSLIFEPGETSKTLVVDIKNRGIYDDDKTFEVVLKNPKNAVLGSSAVRTHTQVNTTPMPTVAFLYASSRGTEKIGSARLVVALSAPSGKPVTVEYGVTGGTAAGKQFVVKGTSLTFAPGETAKDIEITVKDDGVNREDTTIEVSLKNPTGAVLGGTAVHTYTIIDSSPEPTVSFTTASQKVKENAGTATVGVELSAVSGRDVTVPLMASGTAKIPGNYTMTPGPVVIKAGQRSAAITVNVVDNGLNEDDKTVVVSMGVPTNAVQGKTTTSTVTIIDTDPAPTVSFASASSSGEEQSGPARLEVVLSAPSGKPVTVEYGVKGGTAIPGKDYALPGGSLIFEPGETSKTLVVDIKNRGIYDDDKTFEVVLKNPKNAVLGSTTINTYTMISTSPVPAEAASTAKSREITAVLVTITVEPAAKSGKDVVEPTVSFASASSSGEEQSGAARLEVVLSAPSGKPVTVEYGVKGGTAILGKDYALPGGSLIFEPGETSKTLVVDIKNRGIYDDDKTFEVVLKNPKNAVLGSSAVRTHTQVNTTPMPTVAFLYASSRGTEKIGSARLVVALSAPSGKPVTVEYGVTGGTAAGKQFVVKGTSLTFAPGETAKDIEITVKDDGVNREDTTIEVSLKNPTGAVLGGTAVHTYTIIDSSPEPTVSFTTASQKVKENAGTATVGVELSAVSGRDVTVPLMASGTAKIPGNYTMTPGPVVIKAGQRSAAITVNVVDNGLNEDDKTVVVSMGVPTNAVQGKTTTSTVTIIDTDPAPTVSFASASSSGEEQSGPARLEVVLSAPSGKPVTVEYGVKGGTAIPGKDYALPGGSLIFEPGETSKTLVVDIKNRGIYDDDKTFEVVLKNPKNAVLGSTAVHTHTIIISGESEQTGGISPTAQQAKKIVGTAKNKANMPLMMLAMADTPGNSTIMPVLIAAKTDERRAGIPKPAVAFLYASSRGYENVSSVKIPVALSAASGKPVTVEYAVTGGTAVPGMNYTLKDGILTFKPGETVKIIEIRIKDNGVNEDDKTIEVSLRNPKNAVLGGTAFHTYTIMDNDPEPAVRFTVASQQVKKNAGKATVGIELSAVSGRDVTVPLMVGGTAKTPGNYTIAQNPVVIKAGQRSVTITVKVVENGLNEDDKTVVVSMGVPTHASQGKTTMSTVTIVNTDPEPAVTFTVANQQVKKNAVKATIGVELSAVSGRDVTVPLMVGGTAKTPGNYTITPGPIVIKAGERSAEMTVTIADNGVTEDDKTVVVSMGVPTHASQGKTTTSTLTIVDTHPVPTVSFGSASLSGEEKTGPVRLEVVLSAASGRPVTVEYAASGGTAIEGKDYALQAGPLTFAPGETTKGIMVDIKNHGIYKDGKTFELVLKSPKNAVLGSGTVYAYTIINNHPKPTVSFRSANQRLRNSAGRVEITVQLSEVSGKDVIVPFTVGGTANQGREFAITPGPVVIKAGTRSAEIAITMKDNVPVETDKTIEVKLLNPDNAFLGSPAFYRLVMVKDTNPTIAVVPFFNRSTKKNAGDIMTLQFVKELKKLEDFTVIEPGVVRQQFLTMRVIMDEGVSTSDIDLIASNINADLILTGKVMDYQDDIALYGKPTVSFSVMLIDRSNKKVIWASTSYNKGNDAVTLFDWGSVNSANEMVSEMVRVLRRKVLTW